MYFIVIMLLFNWVKNCEEVARAIKVVPTHVLYCTVHAKITCFQNA